MTHEQAASDNLFDMVKRYQQNMPPEFTPLTKFDNAKELVFTLTDSGYKVATAGNRAAGRSATAQLLHASEFAYWANAEENIEGIMQAVSDAAGTEIIIESTANGSGDTYHKMWEAAVRGENDFIPVFIPWFWQPEYTSNDDVKLTEEDHIYGKAFGVSVPHLKWRRKKIANMGNNENSFKHEYPASPEEAFESSNEDQLIGIKSVRYAMQSTDVKPNGRVILGVDPARFGTDYTAFCIRRGRVVLDIVKVFQQDTMSVAGRTIQLMKQHKADAVFIDAVGIGAGVYDRIIELGHRNVHAVISGAKADDSDKYFNKRAEMWVRMRDWINAPLGAKLPNDDRLAQELTSWRYSYDSSGRIKLERKDDLKARGVHSPDLADALSFTFAEDYAPVEVYDKASGWLGGHTGDAVAGY
jgi:hypothetical protein